MTKRFVAMIPLMIIGLIAFIAIGGILVRMLWNWLMPPLFGLPILTFWQALGLLGLSRILFSGLGLPGGRGRYGRRRMAERWEAMTPEERERFRESWRGRCG